MPKCELTIELEEPRRVYRGGETVRGVVKVRVDQDVKCNGFQVRTIWETHGKGNVDRGVVEETIAFQGNWQAGTAEEFPFELKCGNWPPTYHGVNLNVDHYVEAQVDIPWAIDPKQKRPFQLVPKPDGSLGVDPPQATTIHGVGGKILGAVILVIFCGVGFLFLFHPCIWVVGIGAGFWWFWSKYLPKKKLGQVQFSLLTAHVAAGEKLQAEIVIQPGSEVPINEVKWKVLCQEVVVRGHGTDRKTYRHTVLEHTQTAAENTRLVAHQTNRFLLEFPIAADAPVSLDLDDNDLQWTLEGYVDIPRWPDWKKTEPFQVLPSGAVPREAAGDAGSAAVDHDDRVTGDEPEREVAGVSFQATVDMLARVRLDLDRLHRVLDAVQGKDMLVSCRIDRPLSIGRIDAAVGHPDGKVYQGETMDEQFSLLIYAPRERKQEFDDQAGQAWRGWAQITGYDDNLGCLQIKVAT